MRLQAKGAQLEALTQQFTCTLVEKERRVASLELKFKLLLQRIRGSREERIDPDQLLLFAQAELKALSPNQ